MDKELRNYNIPFVGLKNGIHYFNFEVDKRFFEHFENALIGNSNLNVFITFEKKESHFNLTFDIEGTIEAECDRCLEKINLPVENKHMIYVKFEDHRHATVTEDPDIMYINPNDTHLDVTQFIYEFSILSIPLKKSCEDTEPPQECNKEVLKRLEHKLKKETDNTEKTDPRWDKLKKINLK